MATRKKNTSLTIFVLIAVVVLSSCSEDVITVDLNSTHPKIVIEGNVVGGAGPHAVRISKTTDFFKPGEYPTVSGAEVTIADDAGNSVTLPETEPGIYMTTDIEGVPGRTYTLTVKAEGTVYTATSTMHTPSHIDSLSFEVDDAEEDMYIVHCYFTDTKNLREYYRFRIFINGEIRDDYYMYQDRLSDGKEIHYEFFIDEEPLRNNDNIAVEMQTIDRGVYEFFSTLGIALITNNDGGVFEPVPANPTSNLSNDALGYFSAYTSYTDTLVVKR